MRHREQENIRKHTRNLQLSAAEALKNSYQIEYKMNFPGFCACVKPIVILASVWTQISLSRGVVLLSSTGPPTNFALAIVKGSSKTSEASKNPLNQLVDGFNLQKTHAQLVGSRVASCQVGRVHSRCSPRIQALSKLSPSWRWFPPVNVYIDVENPLFHLFLDHFPWVQPH